MKAANARRRLQKCISVCEVASVPLKVVCHGLRVHLFGHRANSGQLLDCGRASSSPSSGTWLIAAGPRLVEGQHKATASLPTILELRVLAFPTSFAFLALGKLNHVLASLGDIWLAIAWLHSELMKVFPHGCAVLPFINERTSRVLTLLAPYRKRSSRNQRPSDIMSPETNPIARLRLNLPLIVM